MEKHQLQTKDITIIGLMAALTCILGPLSITLPFTPVPISFTNLAIYFIAMVLGWKRGTISYRNDYWNSCYICIWHFVVMLSDASHIYSGALCRSDSLSSRRFY